MEIHGSCDPRFAAVREVFEEHFRRGLEIGAAVALCVEGERVVDLWAGHADPAGTRPWERDTIVNVYSTTKAWTALCALRLVDEGRLDLDAPVARYWPEFARGGKEEIPVRWLLSHRAGLPAVREPLPGDALYDWDAMCEALARQEPWWPPGTRHGYHALTFGWLVGEVVRRVSGKGLGRHFREEIAGPLGLDLHVGLSAEDQRRCADMGPMAPPSPDAGADAMEMARLMLQEPEGMVARAFLNPPSMAAGPNLPAWRSAEIPAANGHGTARDLAGLYGLLALDDGRILAPETLARARTEESAGPDAVLQMPTRIGLGFMLPQARREARFGPGEGAFGHPGAGGSVGFADPERRVGFGYVMNRMGPRILLDDRPLALVDAAFASL
ncbi:MAG: serine hydrolase domain-containing protein [Myxococcota bacterium]|nr:serine hydrolase domain-containing protein [Myxococcota bacterium]